MKLKLTLTAVLMLSAAAVGDASAQCAVQPSCASLGYNLTSTSGCLGTATKCPFENKYNCITQSNLSNYSKNSSNWWYQDKATGLIFQGGKVNVTSQDQIVYYNKSLSYAPMSLVTTPYNQPTNDAKDKNYISAAVNVTASYFKIRYWDADEWNVPRTGYVSWFAVGY